MEELQHQPRIEAQRDWGVVHSQQHALRMESIWTEFITLDTRKTLVYRPSLDLSQKLISYSFHSWRWQERTLVHYPFCISSWLLTLVTSSTIIEGIEDMQKSGLASLAMFYYDFREKEKKDLRGLLSSVLFQLCNQSYSYYTILSTFYSTYQGGARSPSNDELIRCFKDLLDLPGQAPVYLIVDALDECPNTSLPSHRDQVLGLLEDLVNSKLPSLRICVTSRLEIDIKPILNILTFRSVSLHDESGQKEDIENYIKSIVNTDRRMRRWTSVHKQLVIYVLTERADGM